MVISRTLSPVPCQLPVLLRIFSVIFPIAAIVLAGFVYGRLRRPDMRWPNQLNMEVLTPALVLAALASKDFQLVRYADLAAGAAVVVLGSGLLAWPVARLLRIQAKTLVPPMMFNNSGNMGIPLLLLAFGPAALPGAVILFLVEMILHFSLGFYLLDHRAKWWTFLRQPVLLATGLGLAISLSGSHLPDPLFHAVKMLGDASVPLALFALGVRMVDISFHDSKPGLIGAVLCPAAGLLMAALFLWLKPLPAGQQDWLWLFAALPPAVLNFLVAEQFRQEPEKVASIVLIGNLASLLVMPIVMYFVL